MKDWRKNLIANHSTIKETLSKLNEMGVASNVLFVVDDNSELQGSVTDGDIRRGLLNNISIADHIEKVMNRNCRKIKEGEITNEFLLESRKKRIFKIPVVNADNRMVGIIDAEEFTEIIPVDAVIMAGGRGERLLPLTKDTPKPLLRVGDKPIIEFNIDRLVKFGVSNIQVSIHYLGDQIQEYLKDGSSKGIQISYICESKQLGTIGSMSLAHPFNNDVVLLMNSDLLTNINFGAFYREFINSGAEMGVATIPHHVDFPYAILELNGSSVSSLKEKPRYTYFANAGIYLIRKEIVKEVPHDQFYNATDLMEKLIAEGRKIFHFPIHGYWLDIGRLSDFEKAQEDVKHVEW